MGLIDSISVLGPGVISPHVYAGMIQSDRIPTVYCRVEYSYVLPGCFMMDLHACIVLSPAGNGYMHPYERPVEEQAQAQA
jgi:hypothetical protein